MLMHAAKRDVRKILVRYQQLRQKIYGINPFVLMSVAEAKNTLEIWPSETTPLRNNIVPEQPDVTCLRVCTQARVVKDTTLAKCQI